MLYNTENCLLMLKLWLYHCQLNDASSEGALVHFVKVILRYVLWHDLLNGGNLAEVIKEGSAPETKKIIWITDMTGDFKDF